MFIRNQSPDELRARNRVRNQQYRERERILNLPLDRCPVWNRVKCDRDPDAGFPIRIPLSCVMLADVC